MTLDSKDPDNNNLDDNEGLDKEALIKDFKRHFYASSLADLRLDDTDARG